ncbi:hypothetical protein BKA65DRAFT_264925 [Rhexocercosporidium sp. MPI-PUGE-AT-0058]|nr:hypothetical protein BKA65DRAFT_264925 [Rhexocercosporidium sp. MPI-PUGE-AT-0058]
MFHPTQTPFRLASPCLFAALPRLCCVASTSTKRERNHKAKTPQGFVSAGMYPESPSVLFSSPYWVFLLQHSFVHSFIHSEFSCPTVYISSHRTQNHGQGWVQPLLSRPVTHWPAPTTCIMLASTVAFPCIHTHIHTDMHGNLYVCVQHPSGVSALRTAKCCPPHFHPPSIPSLRLTYWLAGWLAAPATRSIIASLTSPLVFSVLLSAALHQNNIKVAAATRHIHNYSNNRKAAKSRAGINCASRHRLQILPPPYSTCPQVCG